MHPLMGRRTRAYARDCLGYLGLAAATVPLGLLLNGGGRSPSRSVVLAVSAVPPLAATLLAALQETRSGTPGQRRQGLRVVNAAGERPDLTQALIRNTAKIGLPWQLGHVVAIGSSFGGFERHDPLTLGAAALVYPELAVSLATAATGSGRALHDRLAGTRVVSHQVPS